MIVVDASTLTDYLVGREPALVAMTEALGADRESVWSMRHELTAYDATYLAVALSLDDPLLLTGDGGLAARAGAVLGADRVTVTL